MARVHIDLPETLPFATIITVQIGDINYGNHLSNDALLRLCHEARLRFLRHYGWSELSVDGAGLIMADAAIRFQGQAFHGDELRFELGVADIGSSGFELVYRITRTGDGAAIATVKTGMVFFDYATQTIARTPAAFQAAFRA